MASLRGLSSFVTKEAIIEGVTILFKRTNLISDSNNIGVLWRRDGRQWNYTDVDAGFESASIVTILAFYLTGISGILDTIKVK